MEFEEIKNRIDRLKAEKARAEGQKQAIEEAWKRDYNVSTLEEAEALVSSLEKDLEKARAAQEKYLSEADALLPEAGV